MEEEDTKVLDLEDQMDDDIDEFEAAKPNINGNVNIKVSTLNIQRKQPKNKDSVNHSQSIL
jgi:hypothetical protein